MSLHRLDGNTLTEMVLLGAHHLTNNAKMIDALNVFPVPDGDTGTNMNLSMTSGVDEVKNINTNDASAVANAFAKGLLMGARGNSGVILSQLFRGFSKGFEDKTSINAKEFAKAFQLGVETAYKAVMKPVEGTILTVAKDAANVAVEEAKTEKDIIQLMEMILQEAKTSLQRTPELLPVLKEVGVVDSGGQGLVTIYEGFLAALKGEELPSAEIDIHTMDDLINAEHHKIAQDFMDTSDIKFGYCTEFMVKFEADKLAKQTFKEETFRNELSEHGDSLLVVSDDDVVKVHIHTEYPGDVMTLGQRFGDLINIDIENMRQQHTSIVGKKEGNVQQKKVELAIITVAMGEGIKAIFESIGATVVIEGGQTMNPSTKDISLAIEEANADNVIILPNNKNIVMAAEQAAEIADKNVVVVPTVSIPQGISALLSFHPDETAEANKEVMEEAITHVKTGQVTYAIRDTQVDGLTIKKGNFMGIADSKIISSHPDQLETVQKLLESIITADDEIVTVIYGEDVTKKEVKALENYIEDTFSDVELDIYEGNQPIYSYILAVE